MYVSTSGMESRAFWARARSSRDFPITFLSHTHSQNFLRNKGSQLLYTHSLTRNLKKYKQKEENEEARRPTRSCESAGCRNSFGKAWFLCPCVLRLPRAALSVFAACWNGRACGSVCLVVGCESWKYMSLVLFAENRWVAAFERCFLNSDCDVCCFEVTMIVDLLSLWRWVQKRVTRIGSFSTRVLCHLVLECLKEYKNYENKKWINSKLIWC